MVPQELNLGILSHRRRRTPYVTPPHEVETGRRRYRLGGRIHIEIQKKKKAPAEIKEPETIKTMTWGRGITQKAG